MMDSPKKSVKHITTVIAVFPSESSIPQRETSREFQGVIGPFTQKAE
jgi:hypothetical protein